MGLRLSIYLHGMLILYKFSNISCYLRSGSGGTEIAFVTYGSVVKLKSSDMGARLHSVDAKYSGGSNQQIVTAVQEADDVDSHWLVKPESDRNFTRGKPVECGDLIRLEHLTTSKNLHSHSFRSPLSGQQEVSAFGVRGIGDRGDCWQVVCKEYLWRRDSWVLLKHRDTGGYLQVSGRRFGEEPVHGQLEVAAGRLGPQAHWQVGEGLYLHPSARARPARSEL